MSLLVINEQEVRRLLLSQIFLKVTADGEAANGNVNPGEYSLAAPLPPATSSTEPTKPASTLNKLCVIYFTFTSITLPCWKSQLA